MFRDLGVPVLDADQARRAPRARGCCAAAHSLLRHRVASLTRRAAPQAVHELYAVGGAAVGPVGAAFPGVGVEGAVSREALSSRVVGPANADALRRLEALVHPLVAAARARFLADAAAAGAPLVVLDVPLLYETGGEGACDAVAVVSTRDDALQRERVLARPGMSAAKLDGILARQLPDAEKRARATHVIDTACSREDTRRAVAALVAACRQRASE